jgi:protein-disulfide isomerase
MLLSNRIRTVHRLLLPVGPVDHILGPTHAPVTVVEYGDFECPGCRDMAPVIRMLIDQFPERVRVVFRPFPLERIHPHALWAAGFWEMHDQLFANQSHLRQRDLMRYAERIGLDMARFTGEFDNEVYLQRVRESVDSGARSGVSGTPTFFVNDLMVEMRGGVHALLEAIESAIQETVL